jgi:hypothetical protein
LGPKVAVIGGGILGTLCALNVAKLGYSCDIIERRSSLWNGATFVGEGKIHLGYVYGKADRDTLCSILESAQAFAKDLEFGLSRKLDWSRLVSTPFQYGIPDSSLISHEWFVYHGEQLGQMAQTLSGKSPFSYLGQELSVEDFAPKTLLAFKRFKTPELSVDMTALKSEILESIHRASAVCVHCSTEVKSAVKTLGGVKLTLLDQRSQSLRDARYMCVINCAWEMRAFLDSHIFTETPTPPNLRNRLFVHARTTNSPAALTLTLGPFGDYVSFANGRAYASWYPSGLLGFSESLLPPKHWKESHGQPINRDFLDGLFTGLEPWIPSIRELSDIEIHSRLVVASGSTDIDDPLSALHHRAPCTVSSLGGWISVNSLKLGSAPTAARLAADLADELIS